MTRSAASPAGTTDPAGHLFRAIWDSHVHAARATLAQERGEKIARVGASGLEFSGSPLLAIWGLEAKHLENLARTATTDFEKRAPRKYLTPKRLRPILDAAFTALRSEADVVLCRTPMHGAEDAARAEDFRATTTLHLEDVIEAQLRAAVSTTEAHKEPWWRRALSAVWELVKVARP